jgi:two-component system, NtrC family, sensor kinase
MAYGICEGKNMKLRFPDWTRDKGFINEYEYDCRSFNRIGIIVSIVTWILMIIVIPVTLNTALFFDVRLYYPIALFPFFFFIIKITYDRKYVRLYQPLSALANSLAGLLVFNLGFDILHNCTATSGISLLIIFAFFLLRLRVWIGLIATMTYIIPFLYSMIFLADDFSSMDRTGAIIIVMTTEFISAITGYIIESMSSKIYYQTKEINLQSETLIMQADELADTLRTLQDTQDQLVMSQKLAVIGQVAAGVAHEINTPLAAIKSNIGMQMYMIEAAELKDTIDTGELRQSFLSLNEVSETAIERISEVVDSLKNFARLDESEFKEVDIHEGLDSTLQLLKKELSEEIAIEKNYGIIPYLQCYAIQINQVFYNLILNAAQAIESPGRINIKTWSDDQNICISIKDTGMGIKPENLTRIFDPGFTTKGVGIGRGLGLSTGYKIIENHKGKIIVNSKWKEGTEFIIQLPYQKSNIMSS